MSAALAEMPPYYPESLQAIPGKGIALPETRNNVLTFPTAEPSTFPIEKRKRRKIRPEVIAETISHVDPAELAIISPQTEVLENLWRVGMQEPEALAGMTLVNEVRTNPHVKTLAFLGPPGVGKSTVIEHFVESLFAEAGEEISVKITSFDPAFQRMIKYLPREFWEKVHWQFINDSLILSAKDRTKKTRGRKRRLYPAREIQIIEVPFVGNKATSDRGRTFVEKRWQEAQELHEEDSMLFVPFAPVNITVKKSMNFREEFALAEGVNEKIKLLSKYGIEIPSEALAKAGKRALEILQEIFRQIINSANKKQQAIVAKDMLTAMREELPSLPFSFLEEHVGLPRELALSHDDGYQLRRHIFYWEKTLDEMGVPTGQRYIMINPPLASVHRQYLKKTA